MAFVLIFVLQQVQEILMEVDTKLKHPVKSCTSSAETYKVLQNHMVSSFVLFLLFKTKNPNIRYYTHNSVKIISFCFFLSGCLSESGKAKGKFDVLVGQCPKTYRERASRKEFNRAQYQL